MIILCRNFAPLNGWSGNFRSGCVVGSSQLRPVDPAAVGRNVRRWIPFRLVNFANCNSHSLIYSLGHLSRTILVSSVLVYMNNWISIFASENYKPATIAPRCYPIISRSLRCRVAWLREGSSAYEEKGEIVECVCVHYLLRWSFSSRNFMGSDDHCSHAYMWMLELTCFCYCVHGMLFTFVIACKGRRT